MSFTSSVVRSVRATGSIGPTARLLSTSTVRKAGQGHDESHHGDAHGSSEANTHETFFTPTWRNTFILLTASILIYPYLPSPSSAGSASPSLSPSQFAQEAAPGSEAPLITRWLAKMTPEAKVWTERNDKHLELSKEAAGTRLLFQEAERPRVLRLKYPSSFDQASPHGISVGSQVDLSDLKVKREE